MKTVLFLGNPGEKYANTRHNAGFMVGDYLAGKLGLVWQGREDMLCAQAGELLLVKPQTYMNRSGEVLAVLGQVLPEDILAVVDEVNLPLGRLRLRAGGSCGGHNGLLSLESALASPDYPRLRIGVGSGAVIPGAQMINFVLGEFAPEQMCVVRAVLPVAAEAVLLWADRGVKEAQDRYNSLDCALPAGARGGEYEENSGPVAGVAALTDAGGTSGGLLARLRGFLGI